MVQTDMRAPTGLATREALPPDIRAIVINRINNSQNSLQLIDRVKADHQEQRLKLGNRITPRPYKPTTLRDRPTPGTSEPTKATEIDHNRYRTLDIEAMEEDDTEEVPQTSATTTVPTPLTNSTQDIGRFLAQAEEHHQAIGVTSPIVKAALVLTFIKDPKLKTWVKAIGQWLDDLTYETDDIPMVWELFQQELHKAVDENRRTATHAQMKNLEMKGLELEAYIKEFEELAEGTGLTQEGPEMAQAFVNGLVAPIRAEVQGKPTPGYCVTRAHAINSTHFHRLIAAIEGRSTPLSVPTHQAAHSSDHPTPPITYESRRQWKLAQRIARALTPARAPPKDGTPPNRITIKANQSDIYISACKSMTLRTYLHSRSKRTEALALIDSGATENFINLDYAKYLHLPIKRLEEPRRLFDVDGSPNKSGDLKFYTDLQVQTGTQ
jgi:hypothetical protein